MICQECKGTGVYLGLNVVEPCKACHDGTGTEAHGIDEEHTHRRPTFAELYNRSCPDTPISIPCAVTEKPDGTRIFQMACRTVDVVDYRHMERMRPQLVANAKVYHRVTGDIGYVINMDGPYAVQVSRNGYGPDTYWHIADVEIWSTDEVIAKYVARASACDNTKEQPAVVVSVDKVQGDNYTGVVLQHSPTVELNALRKVFHAFVQKLKAQLAERGMQCRWRRGDMLGDVVIVDIVPKESQCEK